MTPPPESQWGRWGIVVLYAVAMAWVEAAAVYYLRSLVGRIDPYQIRPLPVSGGLGEAELVREVATLVMLFTVGCLAGRTWRSRFCYGLIAFGVWDLFYYLYLRLLTGWPRGLLDWDILFLLPLPWWGPVLAPMLVAGLMVIGATLVVRLDTPEQPFWPGTLTFGMNLAGMFLALCVFMADAIPVASQGAEALRNLLPTRFNWPLFLVALGFMAAPVAELSWRAYASRGESPLRRCGG